MGRPRKKRQRQQALGGRVQAASCSICTPRKKRRRWRAGARREHEKAVAAAEEIGKLEPHVVGPRAGNVKPFYPYVGCPNGHTSPSAASSPCRYQISECACDAGALLAISRASAVRLVRPARELDLPSERSILP